MTLVYPPTAGKETCSETQSVPAGQENREDPRVHKTAGQHALRDVIMYSLRAISLSFSVGYDFIGGTQKV